MKNNNVPGGVRDPRAPRPRFESALSKVRNAFAAYGIGVAIFSCIYGFAACASPAYAEGITEAPHLSEAISSSIWMPPALTIQDALSSLPLTAQQHITDDPVPLAQALPEPEQLADEPAGQASTITIGGTAIPYVHALASPAAPTSGAALWAGSDSVTDGRMGYFIGHNPGDFAEVATLQPGDAVSVCDNAGDERIYTVYDTVDVPCTTGFDDMDWTIIDPAGSLSYSLPAQSESLVLQTCIPGAYRLVVAL